MIKLQINSNALCFIREQTSWPEDNPNFGYTEHKTNDPGRFYLKFKSALQSFGVQNRNRRYYDATNVLECIEHSEYIQDMLKRNYWLGEYDHPAEVISGQKLTVERLANPDPKHSSHYIRRPSLEGNILRAPIQTDSGTEEGMNFAIKIVDGNIIPAFSARVLGELQNMSGKPTVRVKKLITYDTVLFPSHIEAISDIKREQILESVSNAEKLTGVTIIMLPQLVQMAAANSKETQWICESFGLEADDVIGITNSGNSLVITEDQNIYIQPITDKFIRHKAKLVIRDFLGGD